MKGDAMPIKNPLLRYSALILFVATLFVGILTYVHSADIKEVKANTSGRIKNAKDIAVMKTGVEKDLKHIRESIDRIETKVDAINNK